jgi:outer membrane lipoprotein-sorting protein
MRSDISDSGMEAHVRTLLLASMVVLTATAAGQADDAAAILKRLDEIRNPYQTFQVDVELVARRSNSQETYRYKVSGKGNDKSLVEFVSPASENGKYLLMLRDAMWIYMPNTMRPIRISPMQRLAGDASNGDVARTNFGVDYEPTLAGTEQVDGREAYVLDLLARDADLSYSHIRLWVDRKAYRPIRADFYVASGKLLKRANYQRFDVVDGRETLTRVEIEDLVRPGFRTELNYAHLRAARLTDRLFNKDALGKW